MSYGTCLNDQLAREKYIESKTFDKCKSLRGYSAWAPDKPCPSCIRLSDGTQCCSLKRTAQEPERPEKKRAPNFSEKQIRKLSFKNTCVEGSPTFKCYGSPYSDCCDAFHVQLLKNKLLQQVDSYLLATIEFLDYKYVDSWIDESYRQEYLDEFKNFAKKYKADSDALKAKGLFDLKEVPKLVKPIRDVPINWAIERLDIVNFILAELNRDKKPGVEAAIDRLLAMKLFFELLSIKRVAPKKVIETKEVAGAEGKGYALKPHQVVAVNAASNIDTHGFLIFHTPGAGKTLEAIATISNVFSTDPTINSCIIIGQLTTKNDWLNEFKNFGFSYTVFFRKEAKDSTKYVPLENKDPSKIVYWYNPEFFSNTYNCSKNCSICKGTFLVIDEFHLFKKLKGGRSQNLLKCAQNSNKVLVLTGTPMPNDETDIINIVNFLNVAKNPKFVPFTKKTWSALPDEAKSELLKDKISYFDCSYTSSLKRELFPSVTKYLVPLIMSEKYLEKYEREELMLDSETKIDTFLTKLRAASNGLMEDGMVNPKVRFIVDLIDKFPTKKILIFSDFITNGIEKVTNELDRIHKDYVKIIGDVKLETRNLAIARYKAKPNQKITYSKGKIKVVDVVEEKGVDVYDPVNIILISKAGQVGLNLQGTDIEVAMEPNWNYDTQNQYEARGIRMYPTVEEARKQHVDIYYLLLDKGVTKDSIWEETKQAWPEPIPFEGALWTYNEAAMDELANNFDTVFNEKDKNGLRKHGIDIYNFLRMKYKQNKLNEAINRLILPNVIEKNESCQVELLALEELAEFQ